MTNIECYMHDGANWQAQGVLAYLRNQREYILEETWSKDDGRYTTDVSVGRYENCREQGYVFSVCYKCRQRNYAVYEHRNSDELCVVAFDGLTINTPTLELVCEAMGGSKWNYTKAFPCGRIVECGDYIVDGMKKFIHDIKIKDSKEKEMEE